MLDLVFMEFWDPNLHCFLRCGDFLLEVLSILPAQTAEQNKRYQVMISE